MTRAARISNATRSWGRKAFHGLLVAAITSSSAFAGEATLPAAVDLSSVRGLSSSFSDRFLVAPIGSDCSARSWPFYEPECLQAADGSRPQAVRIIPIK
jgi:hypothetical protein